MIFIILDRVTVYPEDIQGSAVSSKMCEYIIYVCIPV